MWRVRVFIKILSHISDVQNCGSSVLSHFSSYEIRRVSELNSWNCNKKKLQEKFKQKKKELPDSVAIKMGCCTSGESAEDRQAAKINNDIKNGMYTY